MTKQPTAHRADYRLRITRSDDLSPSPTYIVRRRGSVDYISGAEHELQLSSLVGSDAAELRFALEDADDGEQAAAGLRAVLEKVAKRDDAEAPQVEVLA